MSEKDIVELRSRLVSLQERDSSTTDIANELNDISDSIAKYEARASELEQKLSNEENYKKLVFGVLQNENYEYRFDRIQQYSADREAVAEFRKEKLKEILEKETKLHNMQNDLRNMGNNITEESEKLIEDIRNLMSELENDRNRIIILNKKEADIQQLIQDNADKADKYIKLFDSLDDRLKNSKDIDGVQIRLDQDELNDIKTSLSALRKREEYLSFDIVKEFDEFIAKKQKEDTQELNVINPLAIDYDKIIDGIQVNDVPTETVSHDEEVVEPNKNEDMVIEDIEEVSDIIEYIPGTDIPRPRDRGIYETDEEYVNYLNEHYKKYENLFQPAGSKGTDIVPVGPTEIVPYEPKGTSLIPFTPNEIIPVKEEKKKKRFKITNVFTPVKEWAKKFRKVISSVVKKALALLIAAALIIGGAGLLKSCNPTDTTPNPTTESTNDVQDEQAITDEVEDDTVISKLGQTLKLNDGTVIYEESNFTGKQGVIGEDSSLYTDGTSFMVNAITVIDNDTNEEVMFNLVGKVQEEKKQIIADYNKYIGEHTNTTVKNSHVTPINEEGAWISSVGIGAWLDPNTTYITSNYIQMGRHI